MSQVFMLYRHDGGTAGKLVFARATARAHLRKAKHDRVDYFSCPTCLGARDRVSDLLVRSEVVAANPGYDAKQLLALQTELAELQLHLNMDRHQQQSFRAMLDSLPVGRMVVVMDFGTHEVKLGAKPGTDTFSDLIFVRYWRDRESGVLLWDYIDCIGAEDDPRHQANHLGVVQTAWLTLLEQGRFDEAREIFIWTDCGPKHFRTSNTLYFYSVIQSVYKKAITVCFFFPRHGHNPADRHHGSMKRHLACVLKFSAETGQVPGRAQLMEELEKCTRTTAVTLPEIAELHHEVKTMDGIQQYLVFTFPDVDGVLAVDCAKFCGDEPVRRYMQKLRLA